MKKLTLFLIFGIITFHNVSSQNNNEKLLQRQFTKLNKSYIKRNEIINRIVLFVNQQIETKEFERIKKIKFTKNSKKDSLKMISFLKHQSIVNGKIVELLLTVERFSKLKETKEHKKNIERLEKIEGKIEKIKKKYNSLFDNNNSWNKYPRIGNKENESNIKIRFE